MTDTQRGDISPTTESKDGELPGVDDTPNWEEAARRRMSVQREVQFNSAVAPSAHKVTSAIESGDDQATEKFWNMRAQFGEFVDAVQNDLVTAQDLNKDDPKLQLLSMVQHLDQKFLQLGGAVNDGSVDSDLRGDEFEVARATLDRAKVLLDELENQYRDEKEKPADE